jgi:SAM-dependent methyltransferase
MAGLISLALRRRAFLYVSMLLVILLFFAVPTIDALSGSGITSNTNNIQKSSSQPSDRILSPEFYKLVYKNIDTNQDQRQKVSSSGNDDDAAPKIGGRTPWDLGNNKPQPAIKRAYEEGKIRGNVLDAGCGVGENCVFLANKYGIQSVTGFDLSEDAIQIAANTVEIIVEEQEQSPFWTTPNFFAASCTEVADRHGEKLLSGIIDDDGISSTSNDKSLFDVVIDSGLLHCLSKEDAKDYVDQISKLVEPNTGRFYIGCFSTANPDPWDNPRRISEEYLRNELFSCREKWEVVSCRDCWWARPPTRGSSTGGAFSLALWVEVRCLVPDIDD